MELKSIEDVALEIDIATTTIRKWDKDFKLNLKRNSKNNRIFDISDISLLKSIKALKNQGSGLNTITKKLNLHVDDMQVNKDKTRDNRTIEEDTEINKHTTNMMLYVNNMEVKIDKLSDRLDGVLELSEKYSRACYEVGSLKAQLDGEQKEKVLLIKQSEEKLNIYSRDIDGLNKELTKQKLELEKKEMELEEIKKQNDSLKQEIQVEKKIPWYKRIF